MNTDMRSTVVVRLSRSRITELDRIADAQECTRSDVIRALLREALNARATRPQVADGQEGVQQ